MSIISTQFLKEKGSTGSTVVAECFVHKYARCNLPLSVGIVDSQPRLRTYLGAENVFLTLNLSANLRDLAKDKNKLYEHLSPLYRFHTEGVDNVTDYGGGTVLHIGQWMVESYYLDTAFEETDVKFQIVTVTDSDQESIKSSLRIIETTRMLYKRFIEAGRLRMFCVLNEVRGTFNTVASMPEYDQLIQAPDVSIITIPRCESVCYEIGRTAGMGLEAISKQVGDIARQIPKLSPHDATRYKLWFLEWYADTMTALDPLVEWRKSGG